MKFLDKRFEGRQLMPINYIYNQPEDYNEPDSMDIIFKDIETGMKHVQHIVKPEILVYIVKPEYRNYNYIRDYIELDKVTPYKVKYRTRKAEVAKIMKISKEETIINPYVMGIDVDIKNFYAVHFLLEYGNEALKPLSKGYLDIENDTINIREGVFAEPGETPINAVTYIDGDTNTSYTLCLRNDKNPQIKELEDSIDGFIKECEETFEPSYGKIDYNILFFDDEVSLLIVLFKIMRKCDNDYVMIWNLPYDISNIIARLIALGVDPTTVISDPEFEYKNIHFRPDNNPVAHKRKHECDLATRFTFVDQLVSYAGIRSAKGKLPSLKLNAVGQSELKDSKIDYSEEGNIRTFAWVNYRKFILYNIKDVLLQKGIEEKTKDMDSVYSRCYMFAMMINQAFVSTSLLTFALMKYFHTYGFVLGNNKNKINYESLGIANPNASYVFNSFDSDEEPEFIDDDYEEEEEDTEEEKTSNGKKKNFDGALVFNTNRMSPTGVKINGRDSKFVHDDAIDQDITSEYPSAARIMNVSNETLIGKFELNEPEKIEVPMFDYKLLNKEEEAKYATFNKAAYFTELLSEDAILEIGEIYMGLPSIDEIIDMIVKE